MLTAIIPLPCGTWHPKIKCIFALFQVSVRRSVLTGYATDFSGGGEANIKKLEASFACTCILPETSTLWLGLLALLTMNSENHCSESSKKQTSAPPLIVLKFDFSSLSVKNEFQISVRRSVLTGCATDFSGGGAAVLQLLETRSNTIQASAHKSKAIQIGGSQKSQVFNQEGG